MFTLPYMPHHIIEGRATVSSNLYKLKFFTVRFGFFSFFGMRSTKKMSEYSNPMTEKLELI